MRPSEKSAVRGSPVHNPTMEALLEQTEPHFNVQTTGDNSSSSISSSFPSPPVSSAGQLLLVQRNNNNDFNLQDLQDPFGPFTQSSPAITTSSLSENNTHSRTSSPPPLTSMDIAALRKSLSSRPKLRRVCHICGRECLSRHKLQRHLSTHSEERPYNCKICGKAFKWTEYLSKHMRTQHGSGNVTGTSNTVRPIGRSTGSTGSTSSNEDSGPRSNQPPALALAPLNDPPTQTRIATPQRTTCSSSSSNNNNNNASSCTTPVFTSESNNGNASTSSRPKAITIPATNTGYSGTQSQSTPDVFSPQSAYDGNILAESVPSSTPLLSNQLAPAYSGGGGGAYFPPPHHGFSYSPLFPMNCYGYPPMDPTGAMGQYGMPAMQQHIHPGAFNHMFPFDASYQNYQPQPQPLSSAGDFMGKGHTSLPSTSSSVSTGNHEARECSSTSSSVSCQTQEQLEPPPETSNIGVGPSKKPSVVIINMCTKKEVGIQCEVGDETLQALFEEESQTLSSANGFDSNSSMDTSDEGPSCVCKYPCEFEGCARSYIHRKDLIRHMKSAHGSLPRVLQPRIIETPAKPYVCQVGECGKSYFHMKDLRRHQRHCHLAGSIITEISSSSPTPSAQATGSNNGCGSIKGLGGDDGTTTTLRFPCDFSGCTKSYIHKKDLIRHKRTFHHDNSSHPSIPSPVVVLSFNKKGQSAAEKSSSESRESNDEKTVTKRFRLDSSSEPLSIAQLPVGNHQPSTEDLTTLSATDLSLMSNISAAVANMLEMDKSPTSTGFPIDSLTASSTSTSSGSTASQASLVASATDKLEAAISLVDTNMYATPATSPSAMFMTLLSQNI